MRLIRILPWSRPRDSHLKGLSTSIAAEQVIYAHCHGESRFYDSIHGEYRGRMYRLVSGDYLRWKPLKILD